MAAIFKMAALKKVQIGKDQEKAQTTYHSLLSQTSLHLLFFRFLGPMSMLKNPLNLNFYFCFIMADKTAAIFKMAAIEGLNYSFSPYNSLH